MKDLFHPPINRAVCETELRLCADVELSPEPRDCVSHQIWLHHGPGSGKFNKRPILFFIYKTFIKIRWLTCVNRKPLIYGPSWCRPPLPEPLWPWVPGVWPVKAWSARWLSGSYLITCLGSYCLSPTPTYTPCPVCQEWGEIKIWDIIMKIIDRNYDETIPRKGMVIPIEKLHYIVNRHCAQCIIPIIARAKRE